TKALIGTIRLGAATNGPQRPGGSMTCEHAAKVKPVPPRTPTGCEECLAAGASGVHLRWCLTCGHVGCCDSSPGRHATRHAQATSHPVIPSYEPGGSWASRYTDQVGVDLPSQAVPYLR